MSLAVNLAMKLTEMAGRCPEGSSQRRRRRNHRAASSLQGRRPQRHGTQFGEIIAAAMGQTEAPHGR